MKARLCKTCGADTVLVNGADGSPVELDANARVWMREIDREPARPVAFWVQVDKSCGAVEHAAVCKGGRA